jgi:anti-sigma28 factor (negative regulator of flagellin synthesis)
MGIQSIPPASDASSRFNKVEQEKTRAKAERPSPANELAVRGKQRFTLDAQASEEKKQVTSNVTQSSSDKAKESQTQLQTQQEIASLDQSLVAARQDLSKETQAMLATYTPSTRNVSYWDQLDVTEKAQKINSLKEKISQLELQRSGVVQTLKSQVANGTYTVSGSEILAGIIKEHF